MLSLQKQFSDYWKIGIGLQKVDNLNCSNYLIAIANQQIQGKLTIDDALKQIYLHYQDNCKDNYQKEANIVASRIVKLLSEENFEFEIKELLSIHKALFEGILACNGAGAFREFNLAKKEPILNGDTVIYGRADGILDYLEYDFKRESEFNYQGVANDEVVDHIAGFISNIWQIHPFSEGNTRTIAIFTIKYLKKLGFVPCSTTFYQSSKYFRDALIRANYQNFPKEIYHTEEYLKRFLANCYLGEDYLLDNIQLKI